MGAPPSTTPFLIACGVIALVSVPLILGVVPPNRRYGIRTTRTLSDRDLWFRANRVGGWAFLAAALVSAFVFLETPAAATTYAALGLLLPIGVALAISVAYVRGAPGR